jgi:hypothetical protein
MMPMIHTDQEPAEVWTQETAMGGAVDGRLPRAAQVVVVAGVVQTRETPPLTATPIRIPNLSQGALVHLVGAAPQRRRLLISTSVDVLVGTDKGMVQGGNGFLIKSGVSYPPITAAEDIWVLVSGAGPGDVTAWAEVDPG